MSFKKVNKLRPQSPDKILKRNGENQMALARFAHVNEVLDEINDFGVYSIPDISDDGAVTVTTSKGVINVLGLDNEVGNVNPSFDGSVDIDIICPEYTPANLYMQITPYYLGSADDNFVPIVAAINANLSGSIVLNIRNASPVADGTAQLEGTFKIFFEFKDFS